MAYVLWQDGVLLLGHSLAQLFLQDQSRAELGTLEG